MNLTDEQVLDHIINTHPPALAAKFRDGMRKYPTPLIEKDCLGECVPEAQDLVVYLAAAQLQKARAYALVCALKHYLWSMEHDGMWTELEGLLEPKKLAVKKPEPMEGDVRSSPTEEGNEIFSHGAWRSYDP